MKRLKRVPRWLKTLGGLLIAGVLVYVSLLAVVLGGAKDELYGEPETMIVLGCQVHIWGPSILLQDRLDEALEYLSEHPDLTVIVSGGQGPDEHTSEAQVMYDYLAANGVEPQRVYLEDRSHNTVQNLTNSVALMRQLGLDTDKVILVSNGFHLTRARMLWGRASGSDQPVSTLAAPCTHVSSGLWMHIREPLALVKSFIIDR